MKATSNKHSKKRNAGLLYEFLVRLISTSLVEGDQQKSTQALQTLKRYFSPGTELYKEFRLLHALMKTEVSNTTVAASIIAEAKLASRQHDRDKLDREKSFLIKHINHKLDDGTFWDQPIAEYRMLATVQTLINDWRLGDGEAIQRVAQYEDQLTKWLTEARVKPQVHEELAGTPGENRLAFKLMMKKLNEKYGLALTNDQRAILEEYVFMVSADRDTSGLQAKLQELKESALKSLNVYMASTGLNTYMQEKLTETRNAIEAETLQEIDDSTITKFMLYMKLIAELETKD
jgi:hypothetical protein